jgi:hypothetical protein
MTEQPQWPDFFPKGIPPSTAAAAAGKAFRLVKTLPPVDSDFLSTYEECPGRKVDNDIDGMLFGVSFHRNLECSEKARRRYKALRNRYIAMGTLRNDHGVCKQTPSSSGPSHLTVWRFEKSLIHPDFILDAEAT